VCWSKSFKLWLLVLKRNWHGLRFEPLGGAVKVVLNRGVVSCSGRKRWPGPLW